MSYKIKLLAVFARSDSYADDESEELTAGTNEKLTAALKEQLGAHQIRLLDFESNDDTAQLVQALNGEEEPDEFVITVDALSPANPDFFRLARCFISRDGIPCPLYVLITHADAEGGDLEGAKDAMAEIWLMENPRLSDYRLEYPVIYCSSDYRHFSLDGKNFEGGIEVLIHYIESTAEYWQSRRKSYR